MSIAKLKQDVLEANLSLEAQKLVISTWGNVSGYDPDLGLMAIKASGIHYSEMTTDHIIVMGLDGKIVDGKYNPSTDTPTHIILYRKFAGSGIRGVVHTHSAYATMWAQAGLDIPCYGTTHADYFYGNIPCTRDLEKHEIDTAYEENTGQSILEIVKPEDCRRMQAVLAKHHAPFVWGITPADAVTNSLVLEYIAKMAYMETIMTNGKCALLPQEVLKKHYNRKFGENAYYGQGADKT